MNEPRHDQVTIADTSIHTITAGASDGPGLLLLHGWPESWATWRELIPLAAPDYRVVAIDLPGIGGSAHGTVPGSKTGIADIVHGLVDTLGLTDLTLVGHDIGGMVAYAYRPRATHYRTVPPREPRSVPMKLGIPNRCDAPPAASRVIP